jgi:uncharacterized protein YcaQ
MLDGRCSMFDGRCSMSAELSAAEARRLALASLGFGVKKPRRATAAHVRATARRLSAIQIDSVNVLARAHYLPTFSRYGPYSAAALDDLAYRKRELFEYWGHAACLLPVDLHPLLRWRMQNQLEAWAGLSRREREYNEAVYSEIAERGPLAAGDLSFGGKSTGPWWGWSKGKRAIEFLFAQGRVTVAGRTHFERLYDITERVIPPAVLQAPVPPPIDAKKALILRAVRAMGIGTARQIAQYFHIDAWWDRQTVNGRRRPDGTLETLFEALVGERRLACVRVDGWSRPAYVLADAAIPRTLDVRAIVSPFDPLMWEREWTRSVFGFDYQIEIYVPAPKRIYGYYVLPFLLGDRFAARVDLKADRKASRLLIHSAHLEPGFRSGAVASALANELRSVARWLSLHTLVVGRKGNLSGDLRKALRSGE